MVGTRLLCLVICAVVSVTAAGCGGGSAGGAATGGGGQATSTALGAGTLGPDAAPYSVPNAPGDATKSLTLTDRAVLVDRATVAAALSAVSDDGTRFTFRSTQGAVARLQPGRVMLLEGTALRTVTAVEPSAGGVVVTTDKAAITDLVKEGTIAWSDAPVDFAQGYLATSGVPTVSDSASSSASGGSTSSSSSEQTTSTDTASDSSTSTDTAASSETTASALAPVAGARLVDTKPLHYKHTFGDYDVEMQFTPGTTSTKVEMSLTRSIGIELKLQVDGSLSSTSSSGQIAVHDSKVTQQRMAYKSLTGDFHLKWTATAKVGLGEQKLLRLPVELKVPIPLYGIPFYVAWRVAFFINLGFSQHDLSVGGEYTVHYDGSAGVTTKNDLVPTKEKVMEVIAELKNDVAQAVTGPFGGVIGIECPRMELGINLLGAASVDGWIDVIGTEATKIAGALGGVGLPGIGGAGQAGGPTCVAKALKGVIEAGFDADFAGFGINGSVKLLEKENDAASPPGCGAI